MKLLVVILCYRVPDLTIDCLRSLADRIGEVPGTKVAVCENGTGGDAPEKLRRAIEENGWGAWCDLTVVHPNLGFCGGNNVILREALATDDPPEYLLLLNADTIVLDGALKYLVDFMDAHPSAGIAGSQLLSPDREVQASPFRFPSVLSELERGAQIGVIARLLRPWSMIYPAPATTARGDWVAGASMILRRSMLEQVGILDEDLYTYFDDIDICLRARRAGWETWYVPDSKVIHLEGASTGVGTRLVKRLPNYWFEARRRFFIKNHGGVYTALADGMFLLGCGFARLVNRLRGKQEQIPPHLLEDSYRNSVFCTGFELRAVKNPALAPEAVAVH